MDTNRPMFLYISGPMSGIPEHNYPAFFHAEREIHTLGYATVNPARLGMVEGYTWEDYLRRDIVELMKCDGIFMLDGWRESRGAKLERQIALRLGMTIYNGFYQLGGKRSDEVQRKKGLL